MSDNSFTREHEETEQADEAKPEHVSPPEKTDSTSNTSIDSPTASRKQLKSPHTVLKTSQAQFFERKCSLSSEYDDRAEHYKRLLQEAEQALTSRDSLISMLQEQLKKVENLYKKSLDDTQDFRFKYCITTKEYSNLKRICEKYKEDIAVLTKEKDKHSTNEEINIMKKEIDYWKLQYKELAKQLELMGKDADTEKAPTSKKIQDELFTHENLKQDMDILKSQYANIEDTLQMQNEKLGLLVEKLEQDLRKSEQDRELLGKTLIDSKERLITITSEASAHKTSLDKILQENETLKDELKALKSKNEELLINHEASQLLQSQDLDNFKDEPQVQEIQDEVQFLKKEVLKLHEKNIELQKKADENDALIQENDALLEQLQDQSLQKVSAQCPAMHARDKIMEELQRENSELRAVIESLEQQYQANNFKECLCCVETEEEKLKNGRVNFALENGMQSERRDNQNMELQKHESASEVLEQLKVENTNLHRQLKQKEDEIEYLKKEIYLVAERKNELIQELTAKHNILKNDYEELLNKMNVIETDLEERIGNVYDNEPLIQSMRDEIEQLKTKLSVLAVNYEQIEKEKCGMICDVENKTKELCEKRSDIQGLEEKIADLYKIINALKRENEKYINERCCYEETKHKLDTIESETNELPLIIDKLKHDNDALTAQINEMTETLQQYKEEAEFKKMENEKLRKDEQHLQCLLSCSTKDTEHAQKEYQQELEKHKQLVIKLAEECDNIRKSCQEQICKLNCENRDLLSLVEVRNEETKKLRDKIDEVTDELKNTKSLYEKETNRHERSLSEISFLFKTKEDELSSIADELRGQETNLAKLEEENVMLRKLLNERKDSFNAEKKLLCETVCEKENEKQKQLELSQNITRTNAMKMLNEKHVNEKTNNFECNGCANNLSKELLNLKAELQKLLQHLEAKLLLLKQDYKNNKCGTSPSTEAVNEMLEHIEIFTKTVLVHNAASESNKSTKTIEEIALQPSFDDCCSICVTQSVQELLIKRQYLVRKVESIDKKMCSYPDYQSTANDSQLITHTKPRMDTDELVFKREHYSNSIDRIDAMLQAHKSYDGENKENESCSTVRPIIQSLEDKALKLVDLSNENACSVILKIVQQISSDLSKIKLTKESNDNCQQCQPSNKSKEKKIGNLQEQVNATCSLAEQIHLLERKLKTQPCNSQQLNCENKPLAATASYTKDAQEHENEEQKTENLKTPQNHKCEGCTQYFLHLETLQHPASHCLAVKNCKASTQIKRPENKKQCPEKITEQTKKIHVTNIPVPVKNTQRKSRCMCAQPAVLIHKSQLGYGPRQGINDEQTNKKSVLPVLLSSHCNTSDNFGIQTPLSGDLSETDKCKCIRK